MKKNISLQKVGIITIGLFLFSCVSQTKPKTITAMAKYLEQKSSRKMANVSPSAACLPKDYLPPNFVPNHVEYAGYYLANASNTASKTKGAFALAINEIRGQGNVVGIAYLPKDALDASVDPDQLLIEKIISAQSNGFKIVIEIPTLFFAVNKSSKKYDLHALRSDYKVNWMKFKNLIAPYMKSIVAFYPFDEAYWNASTSGVSASSMKESLEEIGRTIKADYPQIPLIFVEAFPLVDENLQIPSNWDWVGMDCYGSFDHCGFPGKEKSIPEYYSILKSKLKGNQKLVVIPEAFLFTETPSATDQMKLVRRSRQFLDWIESEPLIVGVFPFIYRNLAEEHISGAREMCPVKEFYKQYLETAKEKFASTPVNTKLAKAVLFITCPTSIEAGSSATCTVSSNKALLSGYWVINGNHSPGNDNQMLATWHNLQVGTYNVQAIAKDVDGNTLYSNQVVSKVSLPPVFCAVPNGYTIIHCSKAYSPYTPETICNYNGPQGVGTAKCGSDGLWH